MRVDKVAAQDGFAKVSVNIGNDEKFAALPWVFMLARKTDGTWKIYDIKTPAYAADYKP